MSVTGIYGFKKVRYFNNHSIITATGKLILNDPDFKRESKRIKAEKYIEEINDINGIIKSLGKSTSGENARFSDSDEDPTKVINLKMKVATMRREMLSLTSSDHETEESESINIFFIDITKEDFEYTRFRHRGKVNVEKDLLLLAFGYNLLKLHNRIQKKRLGQRLFETNSAA